MRAQHSYQLVEADDFMCVPALLATIFRTEGHQDATIESIVRHLKIFAPPGTIWPYPVEFQETTDSKMWGAVLNIDTLNQLFASLAVNLHERYVPVVTMDEYDFEETIRREVQRGTHVVCGFDYDYLIRGVGSGIGHVALVQEIDSAGNVCLLHPGPKNSGYLSARIDDLYSACKLKKDGLWLIGRP